MLESGYDSAVTGISQVLDEVRGVADGAEPPDPDKLRELFDQKKAELDTTENTVRSMLTQQTETGKAQIKSAGDGAINAATQRQTQMTTNTQQVVAKSNEALNATRSEINQCKTSVASSFGSAADAMVTKHGELADAAINGLRSDTTNALSNVRTRLGQYATDLEADFSRTLGGMTAKIDSEADAAAAKVQPAWKRYLSVIIKVVVAIVVAVAIAALFASDAGIGLLLLGGFLIGAAGAIATYLADCALGLKEFKVTDMLLEGLKGGIGRRERRHQPHRRLRREPQRRQPSRQRKPQPVCQLGGFPRGHRPLREQFAHGRHVQQLQHHRWRRPAERGGHGHGPPNGILWRDGDARR